VSNLLASSIDTLQARMESIINILSPKLWPASISRSSTKSFGSVVQTASFTYHPLICLASKNTHTHTHTLEHFECCQGQQTSSLSPRLVLVYSRFWLMCITHL